MITSTIYTSAISLISESTDESQNADYKERAPYLIGNFCGQVRGIDATLRKIRGEQAASFASPAAVSLNTEFPLLDDFIAPASLYLAAMLVIDYDPELYDRLFAQYSDAISMVCSSISGSCESIINQYFMD